MKKITLHISALVILLICVLSTNAQWQQTGLIGRNLSCLSVNGANIFAGTQDSGVYRSSDYGANWEMVNNGLPNFWGIYVGGLISLSVNGTNIFAGTAFGGVFLSTNNGGNWKAVNNGLTDTIVYSMTASGANTFTGTAGNGIFLSTNNGGNWTAVNNGLPQNSVIWSMVANGSNILANANDSIFISDNAGMSWSTITNSLQSSITGLVSNSNLAMSGSNIFVGTYRGVFLSTDTGKSWRAVNNGLSDTSVYSIAVNGSNIFVGTSKGGLFLSTNNGTNWETVNSGLSDSSYVTYLDVIGMDVFAFTNYFSRDQYGNITNEYGGILWKRSLSDILAVENMPTVNNDINIYPNPATNQLTIHTSSFHKAITVSIMNILGQDVLAKLNVSGPLSEVEVDVSKLPSGMYFLQMKTKIGSFTKKFVKE